MCDAALSNAVIDSFVARAVESGAGAVVVANAPKFSFGAVTRWGTRAWRGFKAFSWAQALGVMWGVGTTYHRTDECPASLLEWHHRDIFLMQRYCQRKFPELEATAVSEREAPQDDEPAIPELPPDLADEDLSSLDFGEQYHPAAPRPAPDNEPASPKLPPAPPCPPQPQAPPKLPPNPNCRRYATWEELALATFGPGWQNDATIVGVMEFLVLWYGPVPPPPEC